MTITAANRLMFLIACASVAGCSGSGAADAQPVALSNASGKDDGEESKPVKVSPGGVGVFTFACSETLWCNVELGSYAPKWKMADADAIALLSESANADGVATIGSVMLSEDLSTADEQVYNDVGELIFSYDINRQKFVTVGWSIGHVTPFDTEHNAAPPSYDDNLQFEIELDIDEEPATQAFRLTAQNELTGSAASIGDLVFVESAAWH